MADKPAGTWTVGDAVTRAFMFGAFAATANHYGVQVAARWFRACGLDLEDALAALQTMTAAGWLER